MTLNLQFGQTSVQAIIYESDMIRNKMETITFGEIIRDARKSKNMDLRECAAVLLKDDNTPISFQYLIDLENSRRNPPSKFIVRQMSQVLDIPIEVLYFYAKILPESTDEDIPHENIVAAYRTFIEILS